MKPATRNLLGRVLVLAGLGLLLLWPLRSFVAAVIWDNVGSVLLNRALLAPNLEPDERTARAVEAGQAFQASLTWDPLNAQAYYNLAAIYDLWQDTSSASRALSRAAALSSRDASARFRFGQALAAQGREARAVEEWQAAQAAVYFVNQGLALARDGDREGAVEQYERALAIDPELAEAYYHLGQALSGLGRREEAVAAFESAAALEPPSSPRRHLLRGEVCAARGEWQAALGALQQAADLAPRDYRPHYRMGQVLARELGDRGAAIARFQWALHLAPDHVPSRQALARLYAEQTACDEAARWLAPLLSPEDGSGLAGEAHVLLGNCLLQQGRSDDGLSHLEQAVALKPRSVRYHLALAQGYSQAERYHDAIDAYRQVLELAPDNAQAQKALEELGWFGATDDGQ